MKCVFASSSAVKSSRWSLNRGEVIAAFNDPDDPIRILIATDVASEGLNLQETARLVFHFDIPGIPRGSNSVMVVLIATGRRAT